MLSINKLVMILRFDGDISLEVSPTLLASGSRNSEKGDAVRGHSKCQILVSTPFALVTSSILITSFSTDTEIGWKTLVIVDLVRASNKICRWTFPLVGPLQNSLTLLNHR